MCLCMLTALSNIFRFVVAIITTIAISVMSTSSSSQSGRSRRRRRGGGGGSGGGIGIGIASEGICSIGRIISCISTIRMS